LTDIGISVFHALEPPRSDKLSRVFALEVCAIVLVEIIANTQDCLSRLWGRTGQQAPLTKSDVLGAIFLSADDLGEALRISYIAILGRVNVASTYLDSQEIVCF